MARQRDESWETELGRRFRALRKKNELSVPQLAERLGIPEATIKRWEMGSRMPLFIPICRLLKTLGMSVDEFLESIPKWRRLWNKKRK